MHKLFNIYLILGFQNDFDHKENAKIKYNYQTDT